MAKCKICGKPVTVAPVMHPECWKKEADALATTFCDEYCHWPFACEDEDALEEHCDSCALIRVLNLGV